MANSSDKTIALVAHDARKAHMVNWVATHWESLIKHRIVCTGTTGRLIYELLEEKLGKEKAAELEFTRFKSGPLGGDQQLGALISEGGVDFFVFFWDPMTAQPHDVDVKALLRISTMYNIPIAMNETTADFLIASRWFEEDYSRGEDDYSGYLNRNV
ncbi:MAG: methylglyoxal synthase [Bacteroidia bacterium]|nr:methylglyoxal synthase [Bacteroidia bacterium]